MEISLDNLWGIILAGGEGIRLRNLVRQIYGYDRPKQYCKFIGTRSLLRHTIDRAAMLIPSARIKIVVNKDHFQYISKEVGAGSHIELVEQPTPKDTGAGILLPMLKVFHEDKNSTVALFPSDHFVLGEEKFMSYVEKATAFVEQYPKLIVMLGIHTDKIESGYGWIEPKAEFVNYDNVKFFGVERFWEKPCVNVTKFLVNKGCLINTFVLVGKSKTFLYFIDQYMPDLVKAFSPIRKKLGTPLEQVIINRAYEHLPTYNFSKSVLESICRALAVLKVEDVYWSDWGEEERVKCDLENLCDKKMICRINSSV